MYRDVATEDVVVGGEVGVPQVVGGLPEGTHRAEVTAHFGLRKDHTDIHALQSASSRLAAAWDAAPGLGDPGRAGTAAGSLSR